MRWIDWLVLFMYLHFELHVCVLEIAAWYGVFWYYGAITTSSGSTTVWSRWGQSSQNDRLIRNWGRCNREIQNAEGKLSGTHMSLTNTHISRRSFTSSQTNWRDRAKNSCWSREQTNGHPGKIKKRKSQTRGGVYFGSNGENILCTENINFQGRLADGKNRLMCL